jgi:hypothetical protein
MEGVLILARATVRLGGVFEIGDRIPAAHLARRARRRLHHSNRSRANGLNRRAANIGPAGNTSGRAFP